MISYFQTGAGLCGLGLRELLSGGYFCTFCQGELSPGVSGLAQFVYKAVQVLFSKGTSPLQSCVTLIQALGFMLRKELSEQGEVSQKKTYIL